ncbi:hypothetical protein KUV85_00090 [Nocardioides panacisoli]|uniref:hypothetical protein n=1 Tax=Nocardioides panacisoli TaxID=627624 RepID=UPI001C6264E1|nr:hypothetical protein [Nocardioides panacisoli]QYJ04113.1 hypothetical protein KUV85_00090 [Nocardioides panacisoli]
MTTAQQLRKAALDLREVEEERQTAKTSYEVQGIGFAAATDAGEAELRLPPDAIDDAVRQHPTGEPMVLAGDAVGFRVPLADVNGKDLNALVLAAWRHRAPQHLVERADAPPEDLPAGIGGPATRGLVAAGITSMDVVAAHTEAELTALHGVGPKAIRILREELAARGLDLA